MPRSACFRMSWTDLFSRQHITIPQLSSLRPGEGWGSLRMGCVGKPRATMVLSGDPVRRKCAGWPRPSPALPLLLNAPAHSLSSHWPRRGGARSGIGGSAAGGGVSAPRPTSGSARGGAHRGGCGRRGVVIVVSGGGRRGGGSAWQVRLVRGGGAWHVRRARGGGRGGDSGAWQVGRARGGSGRGGGSCAWQTKYTLIDEQDIPLVEGYSYEVKLCHVCDRMFNWTSPGSLGDCPVTPHLSSGLASAPLRALHSLIFLSSLAFRCSLLDEFLFTCQSSPTGSSPSEILQESVDPLHFHLGPLCFYSTDDSGTTQV
ncbi:translation initiation factor IF-2-like [Ursus arctos]|uniref:translation initiation factor IF-2-like n=1 Tax=Ursus arctos TaxID=9644 RepID=UPI0025497EDB|nr:translation initiation factor IF-2-like [Ursus arctos]